MLCSLAVARGQRWEKNFRVQMTRGGGGQGSMVKAVRRAASFSPALTSRRSATPSGSAVYLCARHTEMTRTPWYRRLDSAGVRWRGRLWVRSYRQYGARRTRNASFDQRHAPRQSLDQKRGMAMCQAAPNVAIRSFWTGMISEPLCWVDLLEPTRLASSKAFFILPLKRSV